MVELLISKGANVRLRDEDGDTPLINAVLNPDNRKQDLNLVWVLLRNGADPKEKNRKGFSALSIARRSRGNKALVRLLETYPYRDIARDKNH